MEIRYLGFDQRQNSRVYRFDVRTDGQLTSQVSVTADMAVFRNHSVGIQEGPFLSGNKLTAADVRAYVDAKALTDAQRAGARKAPRRRPGVQAEGQKNSPWRNCRI